LSFFQLYFILFCENFILFYFILFSDEQYLILTPTDTMIVHVISRPGAEWRILDAFLFLSFFHFYVRLPQGRAPLKSMQYRRMSSPFLLPLKSFPKQRDSEVFPWIERPAALVKQNQCTLTIAVRTI
jgi:hypothetical protein